MNYIIETRSLTKDYGAGKGVFDLSWAVQPGEVFGYLGPNGAGKTTTIRQLLGFIRPTSGKAYINGKDCFTNAAQIHRDIGYLPGEIAFMDNMTGWEFIRFMAGMRGLRDLARAKELCEMFELAPQGRIGKMSKGTKQKVGIVCAFMSRPSLLILDEPTSGLAPLMQNRFIQLITQEKARGASVFLSSHLFEEVERTCDRAAILKAGHIVEVTEMSTLRQNRKKVWEVTFVSPQEAALAAASLPGSETEGASLTLRTSGPLQEVLAALSCRQILDLSVRSQTLEELFLHYYGGGEEE